MTRNNVARALTNCLLIMAFTLDSFQVEAAVITETECCPGPCCPPNRPEESKASEAYKPEKVKPAEKAEKTKKPEDTKKDEKIKMNEGQEK